MGLFLWTFWCILPTIFSFSQPAQAMSPSLFFENHCELLWSLYRLLVWSLCRLPLVQLVQVAPALLARGWLRQLHVHLWQEQTWTHEDITHKRFEFQSCWQWRSNNVYFHKVGTFCVQHDSAMGGELEKHHWCRCAHQPKGNSSLGIAEGLWHGLCGQAES